MLHKLSAAWKLRHLSQQVSIKVSKSDCCWCYTYTSQCNIITLVIVATLSPWHNWSKAQSTTTHPNMCLRDIHINTLNIIISIVIHNITLSLVVFWSLSYVRVIVVLTCTHVSYSARDGTSASSRRSEQSVHMSCNTSLYNFVLE